MNPMRRCPCGSTFCTTHRHYDAHAQHCVAAPYSGPTLCSVDSCTNRSIMLFCACKKLCNQTTFDKVISIAHRQSQKVVALSVVSSIRKAKRTRMRIASVILIARMKKCNGLRRHQNQWRARHHRPRQLQRASPLHPSRPCYIPAAQRSIELATKHGNVPAVCGCSAPNAEVSTVGSAGAYAQIERTAT